MKIKIIIDHGVINKENNGENSKIAVGLFDVFYRFSFIELGLSFYQIEKILSLMIKQYREEIIKSSHNSK